MKMINGGGLTSRAKQAIRRYLLDKGEITSWTGSVSLQQLEMMSRLNAEDWMQVKNCGPTTATELIIWLQRYRASDVNESTQVETIVSVFQTIRTLVLKQDRNWTSDELRFALDTIELVMMNKK